MTNYRIRRVGCEYAASSGASSQPDLIILQMVLSRKLATWRIMGFSISFACAASAAMDRVNFLRSGSSRGQLLERSRNARAPLELEADGAVPVEREDKPGRKHADRRQ